MIMYSSRAWPCAQFSVKAIVYDLMYVQVSMKIDISSLFVFKVHFGLFFNYSLWSCILFFITDFKKKEEVLNSNVCFI